MASSMPVVTDSSIEGHDGTLYSALEIWLGNHGPVTYNPFQSVFYSLRRRDDLLDMVGEESQAERQARMSQWYRDIQTALFGPDFVRLASEKERAEGRGGLAALALARPKEASTGVATREEDQNGGEVMQYGGASGGGGHAATALSATDQLVVHEVFTPRHGTDAERQRQSPDMEFLENAVVHSVWQDERETHTEGTNEAEERLRRMATRIAESGVVGPGELALLMEIEHTAREYTAHFREFQMESAAAAEIEMTAWALEKLMGLDVGLFER